MLDSSKRKRIDLNQFRFAIVVRTARVSRALLYGPHASRVLFLPAGQPEISPAALALGLAAFRFIAPRRGAGTSASLAATK